MRAAAARGLLRAVGLLLIVVVGLVAGTVIARTFGTTAELDAPRALPTPVESPDARLPVSRFLIERHDCWTGQAPAAMKGKLPGHSVVTLPDGSTVYAGADLTGRALDQVFGREDHDLTVWGFCR